MPVQSSTQNDLFNLDLIRSYVDKELNPRFVERQWLKKQVEEKLAEADCRFVLLTAEPGAGKSAFMAWLAHQHPDWCRYFIRRDQRTPLGDVGSYSFLLQVGFQLAATYPDLFKQEQIKIVVEQRFGTATNSEIVGAEIGKMFASPFYEKVIQIQQQVTHSKDTNITGVRIGEFYATERDLPIDELQFMALFDPAKAMLKQVQEAVNHPHRQIVVLVDALDELRYQDRNLSVLKWLTSCPELPANLRFVLTCRPDDELLRAFRGKQQGRIQEISIAEEDPDVEKDLTLYTRFLIETPEVNQTLIEMHQESDAFTHQAVKKANGNFSYLGAIGRAVDEAIRQEHQDLLKAALDLSQLPNDLQDLYAFFLTKIKEAVDEQAIRVTDPQTGKKYLLEVWSEIYQPILGILSVAREPLTIEQIQRFGDIPGDWQHLVTAVDRLRQFLDKLENRYRLYHSTLPEFFTSPETKTIYEYCYVDSIAQNGCIVNYFRAGARSWEEVDLSKIVEDGYGGNHLVQHLVNGDRIEELHTLLSLEKDGKNAWFKVKDDKGDTEEFLADIKLAWKQSEEMFLHKPEQAISLQLRYALMTASINSRTEVIPSILLLELVRYKEWNFKKGLIYAIQIPNVLQRSKTLRDLAIQILPEPYRTQAFQSVLNSITSIQEDPRADILVSLMPYLPETLLAQAIELVLSISIVNQENVLIDFVDNLPDNLVTESLNVSLSNKFSLNRTKIISALIPRLDKVLLVEIFNKYFVEESLIGYRNFIDDYKILAALVPCLPQDMLPKALDKALSIRIKEKQERDNLEKIVHSGLTWSQIIDFQCAKVLTDLACRLPEAVFEAFETVQSLSTTGSTYSEMRTEYLTTLTPHLPKRLLPQFIKVTLQLRYGSDLVKILQLIVSRLPNTLLSQIIEAIPKIDEIYRSKIVCILAPYLSKLLLSKIYKVACLIEDERYNAEALTALAPYYFKALPKAFLAASAIFGKYANGEDALILLAPHLSETYFSQILDSVEISSSYPAKKKSTKLAPYLSERLLSRLLDIILAKNDYGDFLYFIAAVAPNLTECLLEKALQGTVKIRNSELFSDIPVLPEKLAEALVALAPYLKTEALLSQAIEIAANIPLWDSNYPRTDCFAKALAGLAPYLQTGVLQSDFNEVLDTFLSKYPLDKYSLGVLISHFPEDLFSKALDEYCALNPDIKVLVTLLPRLTEPSLSKVRCIVLNPSYTENLTFLVPYIPSLRNFLEDTLALTSESQRAKALTVLAPYLDDKLLDLALNSLTKFEDFELRTQLLTHLTPHLPKTLLSLAIELAQVVDDRESAEKALITFIPDLPTNKLSQVFEIVCTTKNISCQLLGLQMLIPRLTEESFFIKTLDLLASISSESSIKASIVESLSSLIHYLPENLLFEAIKISKTIDENLRTQIFMTLIQRLSLPPEPLEVDLGELYFHVSLPLEVLKAVKEIKNEKIKVLVLTSLVPYLPSTLRLEVLLIAQEMKDRTCRSELLSCMKPYLAEDFTLVSATELILFDTELSTLSQSERLELRLEIDQVYEVFPRTLAYFLMQEDNLYRVSCLAKLAPCYSGIASIIFNNALSLTDEQSRQEALTSLVLYLPEDSTYTLKAALAIENIDYRFKMLQNLSSTISEAASFAFEIASKAKQPFLQHERLSKLIPFVPEALSILLKDAMATGFTYSLGEVLKSIAHFLPRPLSPELLEFKQEMAILLPEVLETELRYADRQYLWDGVNECRLKALAMLAPWMPETLFPRAFDVVRDMCYHSVDTSKAIAILAPWMPVRFFEDAFEIAINLSQECYRVEALIALAPYLPERIMHDALMFANKINHNYNRENDLVDKERATALIGLIPFIPEDLLVKTFVFVLWIKNQNYRTEALASIASRLPGLLVNANNISCSSSTPNERVFVDEDILLEADDMDDENDVGSLTTIEDIFSSFISAHEDSARADALVVVAPYAAYIPEDSLAFYLKTACKSIHDDSARARALIALIPCLPENLLPKLIDAAHLIRDRLSAALVFSKLALHSELALHSDQFLSLALKATLEIEDKADRARALDDLVDQVMQLPTQIYYFFYESLSRLSERNREHLLTDIEHLRPVIVALGGQESINNMVLSIQNVCRWW